MITNKPNSRDVKWRMESQGINLHAAKRELMREWLITNLRSLRLAVGEPHTTDDICEAFNDLILLMVEVIETDET